MTWYDFNSVLANIRYDLNFSEDVLWLDFGHSGTDSGCIFWDKTKEKDFNLDIGLRVHKILRAYFRKIYLTRTNDNEFDLDERASRMSKVARTCKTLHVYSIHCNAWNKKANGAEILLSTTIPNNDTDYIFGKEFLSQYCKIFGLNNRGIVRRKSKKTGKNYYYLHRATPGNCKVKIMELFFGDNESDCRKCNNEDFKNKAAFFLASSILKRYGITIKKPEEEVKKSDLLYLVQVGAFKNYDNAAELQKKLKLKGFDSIIKSQKIK